MTKSPVGRRAQQELAVADALVGVGRALTTLGLRLRELAEEADVAQPGAAADRAGSASPAGPVGLGPRQQQVLALEGLSADMGMSAGEVAEQLDLNQGNAQNVLKRLEALGYLTAVPDERPARWRRTTL